VYCTTLSSWGWMRTLQVLKGAVAPDLIGELFDQSLHGAAAGAADGDHSHRNGTLQREGIAL